MLNVKIGKDYICPTFSWINGLKKKLAQMLKLMTECHKEENLYLRSCLQTYKLKVRIVPNYVW